MEEMDRQFIWAIKSQNISNTRKKLKELSEREDLFDVSSIDTKSEEYERTVLSFNKAKRTGTPVLWLILAL